MRIRKIFSFLLSAICFCTAFSVTASAEEIQSYINEEIISEYEISSNPTNMLNISGNTAYCTSSVDGVNAVRITAQQTLQKYSGVLWIWDDVSGASWSKTTTNSYVALTESKNGLSKGTYRLKSVFTLTNSSGQTETITIYSSEKNVE